MKYIGWILLGILGVIVLYFLYLGTILVIASLTSDQKKEYETDSKFHRFVVNNIAWMLVHLFGVSLTVTGKDKVPEGRFLLVSNHRSGFDPILALYALMKQDLIFVSKGENFNIPFIGNLVHRCHFLTIDREDPRKAILTINKAAELIKEDKGSVGIYPEGTRSKDGSLLPFHDGVLKVAQKAKVPVLVTTIQGTEKIMKNFPFRRTKVQMDILECIPESETYKTAVLGKKVREIIEENLKN